jgi:mRNA interferase HigB
LLPLSQIKRVMKIIDSEKLEDFIKKHADANNAIEKWVEKIEAANWKNHNELKKDFLSADYVGNNRYVFNIRGNNYRLVSVVVFFAGTMVIRFIGTHNDYDRIDAKNI